MALRELNKEERAPLSERERRSAWRRLLRRGRYRRQGADLQVTVAIILATLLLIMVNLLAIRFDYVWQRPQAKAAISERAAAMMAATSGRVEAIALLPHGHPAFEHVRQLLHNLSDAAQQAGGAQIHLLFVDPYRDVAQATELARRYDVNGWCLIFKQAERYRIVPIEENLAQPLATEGDSAPQEREQPQRFVGETLCVTAIARLAQRDTPVVYALSGHGERDFDDYDPLNGYTDLAREIRREGYELRSLQLGTASDVPGDCAVLLIAGARQAPLPEEVARIEAYMARGGRLLLLADRSTTIPDGWEPILARLGLRASHLIAVAPRTVGGNALVIDLFSSHPITRDLRNTSLYFVAPQIIEIEQGEGRNAADAPQATAVIVAPPAAWGESDPERLPRHFDPASDRSGELPLVVAVERGASQATDVGLRPLRAVVLGDSHFAVNALLAGGRTGNRDLLLNALNWLADSEMPAAASGATAEDLLQFRLTRRKQMRFLLRSIVAWPLTLALFGVFCIAIRRR